MAGSETVRFIATVAVIVILLTLHHFYRKRFRFNKDNTMLTRAAGWLILLGSFGLAWWIMNRY